MRPRPTKITSTDTLFPNSSRFRARWTAVRRADEVGVVVHRRATVTAITKDRVGFTVGDQAHSAPADVLIHAADTASGAPLAERLREAGVPVRSEEHTPELQSLMRISYAVFCLKQNTTKKHKI